MRIGIFSTMAGMLWGGSEELWSRAATVLLARGHDVCINYRRREKTPPKLARLEHAGAQVHYRTGFHWGRSLRRAMQRLNLGDHSLRRWLKASAPDCVLVSIGYHTDDVAVADACRALDIPYALLLQAASPYQWIDAKQWRTHHDAYAGAARCFFVSHQNRHVIESNLALDLSASQIVDNPFNVPLDAEPTWPSTDERWKLACVARIHFQSKGQDLLLQALRQPKWRSRNLEITLFGEDGGNCGHVEKLVALHGLQKQVKLGGYIDNIANVWRDHHGLVLPSRFEGNALAMIEAMLCSRVPIVTNVGRVAELVDDNECGFVAPAATVELIDDALERAWQRRHEWQAMGVRAGLAIRQRHSLRPAEDFADALLESGASSRMRRAAA
jgi:glycosyltransferase involved in cell wall biosynthesis